jgi:hypothetical protein
MRALHFPRIIAAGAVFCGLSLGILCNGRTEEPVAKPASLYGVKLEWIRNAVEMTLQQKPVGEQSLWRVISQGQEYGAYLWTWLFTSPLYFEKPDNTLRVYINQSETFGSLSQEIATFGKSGRPSHLKADRVDGGFD